jgi:hypothetical protein
VGGGLLQEADLCSKSIPVMKRSLMWMKQRCGHEFIGIDAIDNVGSV